MLVGGMLDRIGAGTLQADFFSPKHDDTDGTAWLQLGVENELGGCGRDCHTGPVINGTRTKVPTVQMAADQHDLIWCPGSRNLANDIAGLPNAEEFRRHRQAQFNWLPSCENPVELIGVRQGQRTGGNGSNPVGPVGAPDMGVAVIIGAERPDDHRCRTLGRRE